MKTASEFFSRLRNMMPIGIKPRFVSGKELLDWNQEQGRLRSESIIRENRAMKMQRTMGRSGIRDLYINCSFDSYCVENEGQRKALLMARQYAADFENSIANFVFSGRPGTGKNHLAAAIGNDLILRGKTVLIVTVADLMSSMKGTFSCTSTLTEENLLHDLSSVDLLVIDEIGVQSESRYEKVVINQIVDRRSSSKRSTGMLSNLDPSGMNSLLGERVMDRMRPGDSIWIRFNWESYRSRVTGDEY